DTAGQDRKALEENAALERGVGVLVIELDDLLVHQSLPIVWPIDDMRTLMHRTLFHTKGPFGGGIAGRRCPGRNYRTSDHRRVARVSACAICDALRRAR